MKEDDVHPRTAPREAWEGSRDAFAYPPVPIPAERPKLYSEDPGSLPKAGHFSNLTSQFTTSHSVHDTAIVL